MLLLFYAAVVARVLLSVNASISDHSCAILNGGGTLCWGSNSAGQTGQVRSASQTCTLASAGQFPCVPAVMTVTGLAGDAKSFALGQQHTCAILGVGELWCWGRNNEGQIGDGGLTSSPCPNNGDAAVCRLTPTRISLPPVIHLSTCPAA